MKTKVQENNFQKETPEVDIKRVFRAVWKRAWLVALCSILCAGAALLGTIYLITPKYQSTAMFYVNNGALSVGDASLSISSGDITASKSLVETYIVILNSRACLNEVIDYTGVSRTYNELKRMISASSVNETEIFQVVVTSPSAAEAEELTNAIAYILPKRISSIVEGTTANVVDYAIQATEPASPNRVNNTLLGFLIGFVLSVSAVAIHEIFDTTIRSEENIEQCCKYPILASVPDMESVSKGGYYAYNKNRNKKKYMPAIKAPTAAPVKLIGKGISFSAFEAYKLLRTKLQFSFVDEIKCPVIGVSSSMAGEGKSLSSVNLAYSLSQLEKKVLLIDCDMRRPSISTKLSVKKTPGLSEYLTGHCPMDKVSQLCKVDDEGGFAVISAGHNPPNPIELLSSTKMEKAIEQLREYFDYIILDLPPVGEVSDAMVTAKYADGILLIVRQDYSDTHALSSALSQFEFVDTRILGVVMNCVNEHTGRYYRYGYGKKYRKYYYKRYGKGYGYGETPKAPVPPTEPNQQQ